MEESVERLAEAVEMSYQVHLKEAMNELSRVEGALGQKYCGGEHGGYVAVLFATRELRDAAVETNEELRSAEPWCEN